MLNELIFFLQNFPENMIFRIGEFEFSGTRYRHSDRFPWKGRRDHTRYMDELGSKETVEADREFLHWNREWTLEQIHIRFSWALLFRVMSFALLLPVLVILALPAVLPSAVFMGISLTCYITYLLLWRKAGKLHSQMIFMKMLIEVVIEQGYEEESQ